MNPWMPLLLQTTRTKLATQPTRYVQLAVNKEGIVSGTPYEEATDATQAVLGRVDNETQRIARRVGEGEAIVIESGLHNLARGEAPMMVG